MYLEGTKPSKAFRQLTCTLAMMTTMQIRSARTFVYLVNRNRIIGFLKRHTIAAISNSNILNGRLRKGSPMPRMRMTSNAVMRTPCQSSNLGKSKQRAMAEPNSSAKSVAIMATSERMYRG